MRIAITRPSDDAEEFAGLLRAAGHQPLVAPVLEIELLTLFASQLDDVAGLVATSRYGLRALSALPLPKSVRQLPVHVVGGATAALARSLGFERLVEGNGTARGLADAVAAAHRPADGTLLYLRGEDIAFDLAGQLRRQAIAVREAIVYRSHMVASWPQRIVAAFRDGDIDGATLLSPRAAIAYATLVGHHELTAIAAPLPHFCLSSQVATALSASWPAAPVPMLLIADLPQIDRILILVNQEGAPVDVDRRPDRPSTC